MKPAAKLIKDRLAEIGIPRRSVIAATGANGVAYGNTLDPDYRTLIVKYADTLAGTGLGVVVTSYQCGCVFRAIVTTDPRHRGRVTRKETPSVLHECGEDAA